MTDQPNKDGFGPDIDPAKQAGESQFEHIAVQRQINFNRLPLFSTAVSDPLTFLFKCEMVSLLFVIHSVSHASGTVPTKVTVTVTTAE